MIVERPAQDLSVNLKRKYFEFQFYPDLERLQELSLKIQKLQETYQDVPDELKEEFEDQLSQGFPEWTSREYHLFIKSFRRRPLNDYEGMSSEIKTKTADEVKEYMEVFLKRFREIKERDLVLKKF